MSTQDEEPVEKGAEEFRDSGLDQDHVAEAFESMEGAPEGGALLEGETADGTAVEDTEEDTDEDADGGADVASGGGEGGREATTGAVGERDRDGNDR